jgi:hypothetical protein
MRRLQDTFDRVVPKLRAWAIFAIAPTWWVRPASHRAGLELAFQTNRQWRRNGKGLCFTCWWLEPEQEHRCCEGGGCPNFARVLEEPAPSF